MAPAAASDSLDFTSVTGRGCPLPDHRVVLLTARRAGGQIGPAAAAGNDRTAA